MDAESSETFRALANFVVARCANPLATTVSPRGAASAASSRAMRRDARGPSSTNSAYGQFYERPSVPATGARDITYARSGADASHPDPRASAGRRARTPRPGARRPRSRLRWTTSLRWWSRRLTRGARWARSPARWAGPAYDARVREPSKPRMRSTRMRSTRRRDRERRATGIFSSAVGSRRGRASGWKRLARRKPRRSAVRSRAWASRASDPRARLRRIRRKRLNIRREGDAPPSRAKLGRKRGDRSGTPPSRPARRTRRASRARRGRAPLGARRGGTEALRGPPPARRRERRKRRFASRRRSTAFTALRTTKALF